jgi:hypothetical protein
VQEHGDSHRGCRAIAMVTDAVRLLEFKRVAQRTDY